MWSLEHEGYLHYSKLVRFYIFLRYYGPSLAKRIMMFAVIYRLTQFVFVANWELLRVESLTMHS